MFVELIVLAPCVYSAGLISGTFGKAIQPQRFLIIERADVLFVFARATYATSSQGLQRVPILRAQRGGR